MLTVREVAAILGLSKATVYKLIHTGDLHHVRILNSIRVSAAEVDRYLAGGEVGR